MPNDSAPPYRIVERRVEETGELEAVVSELLATPARIAPKYFYDDLGCALYGAICRLPEYYPTRTEIELFRELRTDGFGFDVELLLLAQRRGYRIVEVPINWVDQPGSRVSVIKEGPRMLVQVLAARLRLGFGRGPRRAP